MGTAQDTSGCDLAECSTHTAINALCEADDVLPDGNQVYNVDNCPSGFDIFRRISKDFPDFYTSISPIPTTDNETEVVSALTEKYTNTTSSASAMVLGRAQKYKWTVVFFGVICFNIYLNSKTI